MAMFEDLTCTQLTVNGVVTPALTVTAGTAGTATASKATVLDSNKAIDAVRTQSLRLGASGSEKIMPTAATFSYGTESSHARVVTLSLFDSASVAIDAIAMVHVYLSSSATTGAISGTACTSEATVATNGSLLNVEKTGLMWSMVTSATGVLTITLTQTAAVNYYPVVVLPSGRCITGAILAFAG